MKRFFPIIFSLGLFQSAFKDHRQDSKDFSIQKLAPGVWAAIQNDKGGHAISNAGIVDLGNKTLVFDAFINPDAAEELKQVAEKLTRHPVSFVINSHFHDDHIRGNQAFFPDAAIISTEWTKNEMEKAEPEEQEWARKNISERLQRARRDLQSATDKQEALMWFGYYEAISQSLSKLKTILPNITFKDSLWIYGSVKSVLLIECKNGHTGSDAAMILPSEGIVFMGDLLFVNRHPWLGDGNPDSLMKHLERFYNNSSLKEFVPGHGPVGDKKSLQLMMQYINDLQEETRDAIKHGEADSVFMKRDVLPQYKDWWYSRFYSANLGFLYDRMKNK